eukprot:1553503-Amphidinium_carterae.1
MVGCNNLRIGPFMCMCAAAHADTLPASVSHTSSRNHKDVCPRQISSVTMGTHAFHGGVSKESLLLLIVPFIAFFMMVCTGFNMSGMPLLRFTQLVLRAVFIQRSPLHTVHAAPSMISECPAPTLQQLCTQPSYGLYIY